MRIWPMFLVGSGSEECVYLSRSLFLHYKQGLYVMIYLRITLKCEYYYQYFIRFSGKVAPFLEQFATLTAILNILLIAYKRYQGVCRTTHMSRHSPRYPWILTTWVIAGVFSVPISAMTDVMDVHFIDGSSYKMCGLVTDTTWKKWYIVSKFNLFYVFLLIMLILFLFRMSSHLIQRAKTITNRVGKRGHRFQRSRKRVVLLLVSVIITFCFCLLPSQIFSLWVLFSHFDGIVTLGQRNYMFVLNLTWALSFLNCLLNPIIYNFMTVSFRKSIKVHFDSIKTKTNKPETSVSAL